LGLSPDWLATVQGRETISFHDELMACCSLLDRAGWHVLVIQAKGHAEQRGMMGAGESGW